MQKWVSFTFVFYFKNTAKIFLYKNDKEGIKENKQSKYIKKRPKMMLL